MTNNNPTIILADEEGNEKEYYVIFTFDNPEGDKHFIIYSDYEEDEEGLVTFQALYQQEGDEPGTFRAVEDEEDYALVESVMEMLEE